MHLCDYTIDSDARGDKLINLRRLEARIASNPSAIPAQSRDMPLAWFVRKIYVAPGEAVVIGHGYCTIAMLGKSICKSIIIIRALGT